MKKYLLLTALALSASLYSCTADDLIENEAASETNEIRMNPILGSMTRSTIAHDLQVNNLSGFNVTAMHDDEIYFDDVDFTKRNGTWYSDNKYYWPLSGDVTFYAYSPNEANNGVSRDSCDRFTVVQQTMAADQPDFIVAKTTSSKSESAAGVALNFRHAMSRIALQVKNSNTGLKMLVTDWKVGNLFNQGTFTLSEDDTDSHNSTLAYSDWDMTGEECEQSVDTELRNGAVTAYTVSAGSDAQSVTGFNDFIALPQQLNESTSYSAATKGSPFAGSYLAVEMKILNAADGTTIVDKQWCYWPVDTKWEPGKKYTYLVDIGTGGYHGHEGGDDEDGEDDDDDESLDPVLNGSEIKFIDCSIDDWDAPMALKTLKNMDLTDYLRFRSTGTSNFGMQVKGSGWGEKPTVEYSFDRENWTTLTYGSNIQLNDGETIYLRGDNPEGFSMTNSNYIRCSMSGSLAGDGNVMTLLDPTGKLKEIPNANCFRCLFLDDQALTKSPKLPANTLKYNCYSAMFSGCTALTEAPSLPATELASTCYDNMFYGCSSLVNAPELPATELKDSCYHKMFAFCASLTKSPTLPATKLAPYCYYYMFNRCTSLTDVSTLPATEMKQSCYGHMFEDCYALEDAPELSSTNLENYCYGGMFRHTAIKEAPALPATTLAPRCYANMFIDCPELTDAPDLPATELQEWCYASMFLNCPKLVNAPVLPATELVQGCYQNMFGQCSSLDYLEAMFLTIPATGNCISGLLGQVAETGTFVKHPNATWTQTYDIPSTWTIVTKEFPEE